MGIARNLARIIADNSGAIAAGNLSNAAPTPGLKNRIMNGAFNVWQRGTSFTSVASGQYTADRWQISYRTAGVTVARQNNTTYYAARLTNTDGSPQSFDFEQRIEDVTQFNNSNYVMSFNAKSSASVTVTAQIYVNYGSGGSSQDTCNVVNVSVTTTRTGFSVSLPFPNMSGKTIGANNYVRVLFSPTSLPASGWVEIDSVQIEKGTVATNFDTRSIGQELMLCQRYYYQYAGTAGEGDDANQEWMYPLNRDDTYRRTTIRHPVTMRAKPTVSSVSIRVSDASNVTGSTQYLSTASWSAGYSVANTGNYAYLNDYKVSAEL